MGTCGGCQGSVMEKPKKESTQIVIPKDVLVVTLTEKAASKVKEFMQADNKEKWGLRLLVTPGGCAGYEYGMDFEEKSGNDDIVLEQHGLKVFVDKESASLIAGTEIDFVEGLHQTGFKITNPNAKSMCSCGNSFN